MIDPILIGIVVSLSMPLWPLAGVAFASYTHGKTDGQKGVTYMEWSNAEWVQAFYKRGWKIGRREYVRVQVAKRVRKHKTTKFLLDFFS